MISITGYVIERLLFAAGLLAGAQLPLFLSAYQQRVEGQLEQARRSLAGWQSVADQFHGGSLEALVAKHRLSTDPTFRHEAFVLEALVADVSRLGDAVAALEGHLASRLAWLATHADVDLARAVLEDYQPGFLFTPEALALSVLAAFAASLLGRGCWATVCGLAGVRRTRTSRMEAAR